MVMTLGLQARRMQTKANLAQLYISSADPFEQTVAMQLSMMSRTLEKLHAENGQYLQHYTHTSGSRQR
eukprot:1178732-Prorocentrum_minimum.AAC.3